MSLFTSLSRHRVQKSLEMASIDGLFIKIQSSCFSIPVNALQPPRTPVTPFQAKTFKTISQTISKLRFFSCHVQPWSTSRSLTWKIRRHQLDGNKWKATTSSADPHFNLWLGDSLFPACRFREKTFSLRRRNLYQKAGIINHTCTGSCSQTRFP